MMRELVIVGRTVLYTLDFPNWARVPYPMADLIRTANETFDYL